MISDGRSPFRGTLGQSRIAAAIAPESSNSWTFIGSEKVTEK